MNIKEYYKPMLAIDIAKVKNLQYPMLASPKLDGIRCVILDGVAYSRSMKPLPNMHLQVWAQKNHKQLQGLDGEIICGDPTDPATFQRTTSFCMSDSKEDTFDFYAFDVVNVWDTRQDDIPYSLRYEVLEDALEASDMPDNTHLVLHQKIASESDLRALQEGYLQAGYEGVMLNDPEGLRKNGRSGTRKPELVKVKVFSDSEFEVVGYEVLWHNQNEAETNELGRTKRSTKKEGLVASDMLGKLICKTSDGKEFGVGSGFTEEQRIELWKNPDALIGKLAKVKFFEIGNYEVPRHPVFLGFRDALDL